MTTWHRKTPPQHQPLSQADVDEQRKLDAIVQRATVSFSAELAQILKGEPQKK